MYLLIQLCFLCSMVYFCLTEKKLSEKKIRRDSHTRKRKKEEGRAQVLSPREGLDRPIRSRHWWLSQRWLVELTSPGWSLSLSLSLSGQCAFIEVSNPSWEGSHTVITQWFFFNRVIWFFYNKFNKVKISGKMGKTEFGNVPSLESTRPEWQERTTLTVLQTQHDAITNIHNLKKRAKQEKGTERRLSVTTDLYAKSGN